MMIGYLVNKQIDLRYSANRQDQIIGIEIRFEFFENNK